MIRAGLLVLTLGGAGVGAAAAQADSSARGQVARPDTAGRDTTPVLLPTFPEAIAYGPLPAGARYTFTADSLLFSNVRTLSDLLGRIPGVYVARGGWFGQAEPIVYGGRGPLALEVYWDGVSHRPLGRDSLWLDPARIPLAPLERVDVVVLPAALRVYLVTTRHRSTAPVTQVGIATGDLDITGYRAGYAKRGRSGLGLALLADFLDLDGSPGGGTGDFSTDDYWLKLDVVPPSGRLGASLQLVSAAWHRRAAARVDPWRMVRRDQVLRAFVAQRADGLGWRFAGAVASSTAERDTVVPRRVAREASVEASGTWRTASLTLTGRTGSEGLPNEVEARGGWMPHPRLTLAATARHARYVGDRAHAAVQVTGGLALPLGVSIRGDVAWLRGFQAPLLAADSVRQRATDVAVWMRLDRSWATIEVGRGRRDPFVPLGFAAGIKAVSGLDSTPRTEFVAVHAALRPVPGVALAGWYFDPVVGGGDFEPPHHARVSAAFYSKFWRVFPSGALALRGELAVESWSRWGLAGHDSLGVKRGLNGATYVETNIELQLVGATLFWLIRNSTGMRGAPHVPGLSHPRNTQVYGVRWFFTN